MKLGVAYNIFNGDELLEDSLERLRPLSDYIVLTYQLISNIGNLPKIDLELVIEKLPSYLYDDIVLFEPNIKIPPQKNELDKRNIGLHHAKKNQCTHFMSIDCDEFYDEFSFNLAKKYIVENKLDSTACELVNYFHSSKYQMIENKQYVPFIFKVSWFKKHKYSCDFPVPVDPTRAMSNNKKFYCFKKDELLMHHMSYVRGNYNSIKSKLENSPNKQRFVDHLDQYLDYYNNWDSSQEALNPHQFIKNSKSHKSNVISVQKPISLSVKYKKR